MDNQLQELIELQKEQNQLLKKHLTRIRFSLWALLVLMTLTAVGLGVGVYLTRPKGAAPFAGTTAPTALFRISTGTLTELPNMPPPAASSTGVWEATPNPNPLPSINVSELLNEKK